MDSNGCKCSHYDPGDDEVEECTAPPTGTCCRSSEDCECDGAAACDAGETEVDRCTPADAGCPSFSGVQVPSCHEGAEGGIDGGDDAADDGMVETCTQPDVVCSDDTDCSCGGLICEAPCPSCDRNCTKTCVSDADCADVVYSTGIAYACLAYPDGSSFCG